MVARIHALGRRAGVQDDATVVEVAGGGGRPARRCACALSRPRCYGRCRCEAGLVCPYGLSTNRNNLLLDGPPCKCCVGGTHEHRHRLFSPFSLDACPRAMVFQAHARTAIAITAANLIGLTTQHCRAHGGSLTVRSSRRTFLKAGSAAAIGLAVPSSAGLASPQARPGAACRRRWRAGRWPRPILARIVPPNFPARDIDVLDARRRRRRREGLHGRPPRGDRRLPRGRRRSRRRPARRLPHRRGSPPQRRQPAPRRGRDASLLVATRGTTCRSSSRASRASS